MDVKKAENPDFARFLGLLRNIPDSILVLGAIKLLPESYIELGFRIFYFLGCPQSCPRVSLVTVRAPENEGEPGVMKSTAGRCSAAGMGVHAGADGHWS